MQHYNYYTITHILLNFYKQGHHPAQQLNSTTPLYPLSLPLNYQNFTKFLQTGTHQQSNTGNPTAPPTTPTQHYTNDYKQQQTTLLSSPKLHYKTVQQHNNYNTTATFTKFYNRDTPAVTQPGQPNSPGPRTPAGPIGSALIRR